MHGTRKWLGESALAWMIVIVLHAMLWRELSRIDAVRFQEDEDATRLQLLWIKREPPRIVAASQAISSSTVRKPRIRAKANVQAAHDAAISPRDNYTPPQPTRSLSAVFLGQGLRHVEQLAFAERAPADPFASRRGGLQAPAADTIRMKRQFSPKDVVAAVGQYLFAPPGYEQDPCPQNQRNIRKWMDGSNPEAMQHELDYEREYCRP